MGHYSYYPPYVPVWKRREKAAKEVQKLAKGGVVVEPVKIDGRAIATSSWGKGWCTHLEKYSDYYNRLERGRTYVRNGSVVHLSISEGCIEALVSGSSLYRVNVQVKPLDSEKWKAIIRDCYGKVASLIDLLSGTFSSGVMNVLAHPQEGLFPQSREITFKCSCPDYASMCKHVAAVLYGIGARLDDKPELLFKLRRVDETELIAKALDHTALMSSDQNSGQALGETEDLSSLFGIDIAAATPRTAPPRERKPANPAKTAQKPAAKRGRSGKDAGAQDPSSRDGDALTGLSGKKPGKKRVVQKTPASKRKTSLIAAKQLLAMGFSRTDIARLLRNAVLKPHSRGVYQRSLSDANLKSLALPNTPKRHLPVTA